MLFVSLFSFLLLSLALAHEFDGQGYYDIQFQGAGVGSSVLARIERLVGYQKWKFAPPNGIFLWIADAPRLAELERTIEQLSSITRVEPTRRSADLAKFISALPMRHGRVAGTRVQADGPELPEESGLELFADNDSFEHDDESGALVVRLRVQAHNASAEDLLQLARPSCRTQMFLIEQDGIDFLFGGVHCDDAPRVADQLVRDGKVGWVDVQVPHHTLNRWSGITLRAGAAFSPPVPQVLALNGSGQILAVSDTGVETTTCFFRDNARPVPNTRTQSVPLDTGHRKIRAYWSGSGGDLRDLQPHGGHGTHVSATAVGSAHDRLASKTAQFDGAAPAARLAIVDLLPPNNAGFLQLPLNLGPSLMKWSSDVGAYVHTASWGADAGARYTSDEQDLDLFAYKNREFLMIFAAGNDGPRAASISSPSYAKNVLSVGSTMNGIESVALAQRPTRPASDYTPDWISAFSSRGSAQLSLRKPDVVAPGGPYVWSAFSGASSSCTSFDDNVIGLAGTSMATPLVAGGALLLRQYFVQGLYPNSAGVSANTERPTGSLLRALLVASAQPMLGVFPRQTFASAQQRIDASGHGRVALSTVIDSPTVQLAVLANEDASNALSRSRTWQWCVEVVDSNGAPVSVGVDYGQVVVSMSYADYPSTPVSNGAAFLVNDLRLSVLDFSTQREFRVNDQATPERRSTNERAVADSTRFTVAVTADTLAFGDTQTFSLVLVLQRRLLNTALRISEPSQTGRCMACARTQRFDFDCSTCGNGLVEAPGEQCDKSACCNNSTCQLLPNQSPCFTTLSGCRLSGRCLPTGCSVDGKQKFRLGPNGECDLVPVGDTNACIFKDVASWRAALRSDRAVFERAEAAEPLCCAPLWAAMEQIEFELLFASLTREYVAARLNMAQPNAAATAEFLLAIEDAQELLEQNCGLGFTEPDERANATALVSVLRRSNSQCVQASTTASQCSGVGGNQNRLLCSGGGLFDRESNICICDQDRQTGEADCAHLACSGQGASVYDYEQSEHICICLDGWAGEKCDQCALPADSGRLVRICLGMPLALRDEGVPNRVPVVVERVSVAARLTGSFYNRRIPKLVDSLPGAGGLDCWCRTEKEKINWRLFDNHAEVLQTAILQRAQLDAWATHAQAVLAGQPISPVTKTSLRHSATSEASAHAGPYWILALVLALM